MLWSHFFHPPFPFPHPLKRRDILRGDVARSFLVSVMNLESSFPPLRPLPLHPLPLHPLPLHSLSPFTLSPPAFSLPHSSFVAMLFHTGLMLYVIKKVAWVMGQLMGTTAAESLVATANIFVGQSEAPLMIRPFLPVMTNSGTCTFRRK